MSLILLVALILAALSLSCGGGQKEEGPVTLTIWQTYNDEESALFQKLLAEYQAANPDVTIEATRLPFMGSEPKILTGSNHCDIGFAADPDQQRLVVVAAVDNLMKGAAGNAVQTMNVMYGFPETLGLEFPGLHPV